MPGDVRAVANQPGSRAGISDFAVGPAMSVAKVNPECGFRIDTVCWQQQLIAAMAIVDEAMHREAADGFGVSSSGDDYLN